MGREKDRESSLTSYRHRQTRLDVREISVIYYRPDQRGVVRNKTKSYKHLPPIPPFLPGSASLPISLPPPCQRCRATGNGDCSQFIARCLCRSFLLTLCPCSSVGSLPRETVLHDCSSVGPSHGLQLFMNWPSVGLFHGVQSLQEEPAPPGSSPQASGESPLQCLERLLPLLLHWPWCLQSCFSHIVSVLFSSCSCAGFPPLPLTVLTQRHWVADGLGLGQRWVHLGAGWRWLCWAWGTLLAASHRSHSCSPLLPKPCHANPVLQGDTWRTASGGLAKKWFFWAWFPALSPVFPLFWNWQMPVFCVMNIFEVSLIKN